MCMPGSGTGAVHVGVEQCGSVGPIPVAWVWNGLCGLIVQKESFFGANVAVFLNVIKHRKS